MSDQNGWKVTETTDNGIPSQATVDFDSNGHVLVNNQDWGTWVPADGFPPAQVKCSSSSTDYTVEFTPGDANTPDTLTCSTAYPSSSTASSQANQGTSQAVTNVVGGLALGTLAGALAGLPLGGTLLVAAVTTGGSLLISHLLNEEEKPTSEAQGSSWTAQGGTQGGSGGSNLIGGLQTA